MTQPPDSQTHGIFSTAGGGGGSSDASAAPAAPNAAAATSTSDPSSSGASSVEVYGFVGWIASAVAAVLYMLWAFLPESVLHALGVTYYPSKHWALTIPVWFLLLIVFIIVGYECLNKTTVLDPTSLYTLHDDRSKWAERMGFDSVVQDTTDSIPPLMHIPAPVISMVLYGGKTMQEAEAELRRHQAPPPPAIRRRQATGVGPTLMAQAPPAEVGPRAAKTALALKLDEQQQRQAACGQAVGQHAGPIAAAGGRMTRRRASAQQHEQQHMPESSGLLPMTPH